MKIFIIILLVAGPLTQAQAQSTGDWIQFLLLDYQKLTQLKSVLSDMQRGYSVIKEGYTSIRQIAESNFNLHKLFLDGLLAISPAVSNDVRVTKCLSAEYALVREYRSASLRWHASRKFTVAELTFIDLQYAALLTRSMQTIEELTMVLTAEILRMSDADRLQAIDRVYAGIQGQLAMLRRFNDMTALQLLQRERADRDINALKKLYDLP